MNKATRSSSGSAWLNEIVYLRGLAILAVIFAHVAEPLHALDRSMTPAKEVLYLFTDWITGYPAFVFASGFVLGRTAFQSLGDWKEFYSRRLMAVVPPYLFFSAVYFVAGARYRGHSGLGLLHKFAAALVKGTAAFHLWFLSNILQLYVLLPVFVTLAVLCEKKRRTGLFLLSAFLIQAFWLCDPALFTAIWHMVPTLGRIDMRLQRVFISSLFYFCLGIVLGRHPARFEARMDRVSAATVAAVGLVFFAAMALVRAHGVRTYGSYYMMQSYDLMLYSLVHLAWRSLSIFVLFKIARHFCGKSSRAAGLVGAFGQYSFGVFLVHVLFLTGIQRALENSGVDFRQAVYYGIVYFGTAVFSLVSVQWLARLPGSRYLIGKTAGRGILPAERGV